MLWILISQDLYGVWNEAWPMFRHDYKRTGHYKAWKASCSSMSHLYDVVHGTMDESVISRDANGDGYTDVIGTQAEAYGVKVIHGWNGTTIWQSGSDRYSYPPIPAAASDTRVFAVGYNYFQVFNLSTGSTIYRYSKGGSRDPAPAVADIDNDGCPEVYTAFGRTAVAINGCASSYSTLWTYSLPASPYAPALGDVDGDGDLEVLYPTSNSTVYVLDAATGSFHSSFSFGSPYSGMPDYTVALDDLDGDGKDEVVTVTTYYIKAHDFNYGWSENWSVFIYSGGSVPALGDKDGDGLPDVWVIRNNNVYVYKGTDGSLLGSSSVGDLNSDYPPSLADLTGDRIPDVLAIKGSHYVRVINGATLTPVMTLGSTPYGITSEVVVLKLRNTLGLTVGDHSCHINTWGGCLIGTDDELSVGEKEDAQSTLKFDGTYVVAKGREIEIYDRSGHILLRGYGKVSVSSLPKGIYFARSGEKVIRIAVR